MRPHFQPGAKTNTASEPTARLEQVDLKIRLIKLHSALKHRITNSDRDSIQFARSCVKQLEKIRGGHLVELRYECLETCVPYFYATGRLEDALEAASMMLGLADRSGRKEWIRKAHNFLGVIHAATGDVSFAIVEYHEALKLAEELDNREGMASSLTNIGAVLYYGALFRDAIPCLHKALEIAASIPRGNDFEYSACGNLAQIHLALGESEAAYEFICRCIRAAPPPKTVKDFHSRTIHELVYVEIAIRTERLREAQVHALECQHFARCSGSSHSIMNSRLANGLLDCHCGNAAAGIENLKKCLEDSAGMGIQTRMTALGILAKACQSCQRPHMALDYLKEVLANIRDQRDKQRRALISLSSKTNNRPIDDYPDLHALAFTEASLRAATAELAVENAQRDMLERLAITASLREDGTGAHGYRVGALSTLVAAELGWTGDQQMDLEIGGRLHDIGTVAIPDRIALSDHAYEEAEREIMRSHTTIGAELLANNTAQAIRLASDIARFHHEWWNGTGYPAGLSGRRIPLPARIVAICDVFDALTHGRPYAPALEVEDSLRQIDGLGGKQFDPELVPIFISVVKRLAATHPDLDSFLCTAARVSPYFSARVKIRSILESRSLSAPSVLDESILHG